MLRPAKLDYGMAHVLLVSKSPDLLLNLCDEAVWQWLNSNTTTPIRREWMPWLRAGLVAKNRLQFPQIEVGCSVGICTATTDDVDNLVIAAVRSGKVQLT